MAFTADKVRQGVQQAGGYSIDNSLRFNDDDSAYLSWTAGTATNRKKWTLSMWVKRGNISSVSYPRILSTPGSGHVEINFMTDETLRFEAPFGSLTTSQKFRDPSAWYHILYIYDSTISSPSGLNQRLKLYVNGSQVSDFASTSYPTLNQEININNAVSHQIGRYAEGGTEYFDGYLAEVHFIDGQALDHTSFGETGTYGEWKPIEVTGMTYGTNGFYLDFSNSGTKHTLTANGNAQHSTAQSKIGSSSILFDGSGDNISLPQSSDFAFGDNDFTIEYWIRLDSVSSEMQHIGQTAGGTNTWRINSTSSRMQVYFGYSGSELSYFNNSGSNQINTADTWYHVAVVKSDSTIYMYINGATAGSGAWTGSMGEIAGPVRVGHYRDGTGGADGYMDEIRISNVARYTTTFTPSTTAFTDDANTLLLIHSDTTNGSTTFTDDSGVVGGLGNDASSNTNNWTVNNLAATDQMLDSPTNNFCTLNSVSKGSSIVLKEGNLDVSRSVPGHRYSVGTLGVSSGKWYWEIYLANSTGTMLGIATPEQLVDANDHDTTSTAWNWDTSGPNSYGDGNGHGIYGSTTTLGDIVGVELDMDAGTIDFYKNNVSEGEMFNTLSGNTILPCAYIHGTAANVIFNFGQDSSFAGNKTAQGNADGNGYGDFYYTPPTGYLALCTSNLPDPAVIPSEHFKALLDTGANIKSATEGEFTTQLAWIKDRANFNNHQLIDSVRGTSNVLQSNSVGAETTYSTPSGNSVGWVWKAGGSDVLNENGTIDSQVSANADAGFSIVSYTGNETSGATVGHGLSSVPEMMIVKARIGNESWSVYSKELGNTKYMELDGPATPYTYTGAWNNTTPSTTLFTLGDGPKSNKIGNMIAYCFHSVEGYSKVGSYTANGSSDGTFIYTGFSPAYILFKRTDSTSSWTILDSTRTPNNPIDDHMRVQTHDPEMTSDPASIADFTSNGFKLRTATNATDWNTGSGSYIYLAFAEHPFKHTNAR